MWLALVAHRVVSSSNRDGSRCRVHEGCSCLSVAMSAFLPMCLSDITDTLWNVDNLFPLALGRQHSSLHDAVALALVSLSASLSLCLCLHDCSLSTCPSICLCVCLPACPSIHVCMAACRPGVRLSVCLFACMPVHLPASLPACLFV